MKKIAGEVVCLSLIAWLVVVTPVYATMSSTNYRIDWDTISVGGDDTSSSASYILRDSVGNPGAGSMSSSNYSVNNGYRAGVYDRSADFSVLIQDRASQVAATAITATTVTVTSVSGFSQDDYIAVIQDEGQNQVSAIGKISSIASPVITVDSWTYTSSLPSINSSNDYVYALDSSTLSLGTLVPGNISTALIAWEATAEVDDGYSVYIHEDQNLTSGTDSISDVADGDVSGVNDEYGARSFDSSLALSTFDTLDTAISSTPAQIASTGATAFEARGFLTLKATVDGTIPAGTYTQTLTVMYVGDY